MFEVVKYSCFVGRKFICEFCYGLDYTGLGFFDPVIQIFFSFLDGTPIDGYLHSGDVGELDERGRLKITDRKKDLIITAGGKNITPQNIENRLKFSPYINDAIVIGDRLPFLTALILIDEENVTNYAQENRIPFTTYSDLAGNPDINKLMQGEVRAVNKELSNVERIKKFTILDKRTHYQ